MSDEVQAMFSVREVPWHGKGKVVDGVLTAREAIIKAGLDWEVSLCPVHVDIPGTGITKLDDRYATVRLDDKSVLGIVGSRYRIVQNKELFSFFDPVVKKDEAIYHTGGVLCEGRKVWILAKIPGEYYVPGVPDDLIENYLLLASSHDGSLEIVIKHTPIRVVCWNTLSAALRVRATEVRIRHTATAQAELASAHTALGLATKRMDVLQQAAEVLVRYQMKPKMVNAYLGRIVPSKVERLTNETPAVTRNKRDRIKQLFIGADTNTLKGMRGSAWAMYNATCEWVDHDWMARKDTDTLDRAWFGTGEQVKHKSFVLLTRLVKTGELGG